MYHRLRESMTLFEVDRIFWMRQDFCLGEPLGEPREEVLTSPEKSIHLEKGHGFFFSRQDFCLGEPLGEPR